MEQAKIQENTAKLIDFVSRKFEAGELDNNTLVELFKHTGRYLNLQTISDYARDNKMRIAKICTIKSNGVISSKLGFYR